MSGNTQENTNKRKSLGRGLGSLISTHSGEGSSILKTQQAPKPGVANENKGSTASETSAKAISSSPLHPESRVWSIAIEKLQASSFQPRTHFQKEKLEELAQSIKSQGILQPIVARKLNEQQFEIIAGERRWRAAQLAGLHEVPVIIKTLSNKDTLELAIIENVQREDLNPIEEAEAYLRLNQEFGMNQQQIAEKVGKERATVANSLRLLALPSEVRQLVVEGSLSQGHAKVLLSLPEADLMVKVARKTLDEGWSVRQMEKVVMAYKNLQGSAPSESSTESKLAEKLAHQLAEDLQQKLGTKVSIDYRNGKGKITLQFYSDAELNSLADRLRSAE